MDIRLICRRSRLPAAEFRGKLCQGGSGYGFFQCANLISKNEDTRCKILEDF